MSQQSIPINCFRRFYPYFKGENNLHFQNPIPPETRGLVLEFYKALDGQVTAQEDYDSAYTNNDDYSANSLDELDADDAQARKLHYISKVDELRPQVISGLERVGVPCDCPHGFFNPVSEIRKFDEAERRLGQYFAGRKSKSYEEMEKLPKDKRGAYYNDMVRESWENRAECERYYDTAAKLRDDLKMLFKDEKLI